MLSPHVIQAVEKLLMEGKHSHREIARLLRVSRMTVQGVYHGGIRRLADGLQPGDDPDLETGPIERCATCRGRVYMPCRLCAVRAWQIEHPCEARRAAQLGSDAPEWTTDPGRPNADPTAERHRNPPG